MNDHSITIIDKINGTARFFVRDNQKKTFVLLLTGKSSQDGRVEIIIRGKNAGVQILGLIIGRGESKINLYTLQEHEKEQSVSDLFIKSVLFDRSRLNYEGLIKIAPGAQKSNAYQKNQNLLLSPHVWADSRPKLEILANDVRCTHGATIGKIDPEIIYYLQTRGLSKEAAEGLVVRGFFNEVLERIPDRKTAGELREKLDKIIGSLI